MKTYHTKRIELHNHTIESDGQLTAPELADYFYENDILHFSLTDHNTISGHAKMQNYLNQVSRNQDFIFGYELTSYYGHLLCHNVHTYIPWDDIELQNADILLDRVHEAGGLVGIAHPYNMGSPISSGLLFTMKIHDYSKIDFIEIVNNADPMIPDNQKSIPLWESLYLQGYQIAPVSGLDLHQPRELNGVFTTYLLFPDELLQETLENQLTYSIKNLRTCVTVGPILHSAINEDTLYVQLEETTNHPRCEYHLVIKSPTSSCPVTLTDSLSIPLDTLGLADTSRLVLELYTEDIVFENLCAITAVQQ